MARSQASNTARLRVSSPTPGANNRVPSRRTVRSVPGGNTVSRCAATQISGPLPMPRRRPVTLPSASVSSSCKPWARAMSRNAAARVASWKDGAAICVSATMSRTVRSCSARSVAHAVWKAGLSMMRRTSAVA